MNNPNTDVKDLIIKAKAGNQMAFSALLDYFWNYVYGFQLRRTENENDAEDISIRTFSKAFEKIQSFDESYEFSTWLISISKNLHVDLIRKKKGNILSDRKNIKDDEAHKLVDESPSAEDNLIIEQNLNTLLADIKKLKPHYQQVINLRYFNEMSYLQIADELNEPLTNIKVKLLRAKKLLAEIITSTKA